jgi:16S rRNA (cytidine1402-2'-O)-methyltransferase
MENATEPALYLVSTPIGNLKDITIRALEILEISDFIICEDTRITAKLLDRHNIKDKKFIVYNDNSCIKTREKILNYLLQKKILALVSDAGTPLISDPGHKLIGFLRDNNQKIVPIPGASALTAAISASSIACDNFLFLGFLPSKKNVARAELEALPRDFSFVFFESPSRVLETLQTLKDIYPSRKIAVARELTKLYEEITSGNIAEIVEFFSQNKEKLRGEFVIIVEKSHKKEKTLTESEVLQEIKNAMESGIGIKTLSKNLSSVYGFTKKEIYKLVLKSEEKKSRKIRAGKGV